MSPAHERSPALDLLDAIDAYQSRAFFSGRDVARLVVQHVREFDDWWNRRTATSIDVYDLVCSLRKEPGDWPRRGGLEPLSHFSRIRMPGSADWVTETRGLLQEAGAWRTAKFLITPAPNNSSPPLLDVFTTGSLSTLAAAQIAARLTSYTAATWARPDASWVPEVWQSNSEFALSVLQERVTAGYRVELLPTPTSDSSRVGYGMFSDDLERAAGRLHHFASLVRDDARRAEIVGLEEMLRKFGPAAGAHMFVALGSVVLVSEGENTHAAEIDGVFATFKRAEVRWYFYEHKRTKDAGLARGQLRSLGDKLLFPVEELWEGSPESGGGGVLFSGVSHALAEGA